ncbi:MAG: ABC transporter permease [Thermaerobacter sp.]|nr:ABC transporter permease [Thermaerobacter sp.]
MKQLFKVTGALLRTLMRNRQALFWTFFFPVLLMVVFGFLGNSNFKMHLLVAGGGSQAERKVVQAFEKIPYFHVQTKGKSAAIHLVKIGQADGVLVLPTNAATPPWKAELIYNSSNVQTAQQTVSAVETAAAQINLAFTGRPAALVVQAKAASGSRSSTFLDFLLPGILALMAMQNSLFGVAGSLTRWKEKGVLRRFLATPLRPLQFLGGVVLYQLVFGLLTSAVIVAIAMVFLHANVSLPVIPLLLVVVIGMAAFLSLGFVIAGVSRTEEATLPIINVISFPMMFLSGVFFPVTTLPHFLRTIVQYLPLTYLVDGIRGMMSGQYAPWSAQVGGDMLALLIWFVVLATISARTWRWE